MNRARSSPSGFSLVEVTLALGVASISLIAIFSLLPVGLRTSQNAIEQTVSADILSAVAADLRATPPTTPRGSPTPSPQFLITIPGNPVTNPTTATLFFNSDDQCATTLNGSTKPDGSSWSPPLQTRYRLTITFPSNGTGTKTATFVQLKMTWPAAASLTNALGSAEMFIALDRN